MDSVDLLSKETYDVSQIQKIMLRLEDDPALLSTFRSHAMVRAHDIYNSGGLDKLIGSQDRVLYIGTGSGHVAHLIEYKTGAKVFKLDLSNIRSPDINSDRLYWVTPVFTLAGSLLRCSYHVRYAASL